MSHMIWPIWVRWVIRVMNVYGITSIFVWANGFWVSCSIDSVTVLLWSESNSKSKWWMKMIKLNKIKVPKFIMIGIVIVIISIFGTIVRVSRIDDVITKDVTMRNPIETSLELWKNVTEVWLTFEGTSL